MQVLSALLAVQHPHGPIGDLIVGGSLAIAGACALAFHFVGYVNGRYDTED